MPWEYEMAGDEIMKHEGRLALRRMYLQLAKAYITAARTHADNELAERAADLAASMLRRAHALRIGKELR